MGVNCIQTTHHLDLDGTGGWRGAGKSRRIENYDRTILNKNRIYFQQKKKWKLKKKVDNGISVCTERREIQEKNLESLLAESDIFSSYIFAQELIWKYEEFKATQ